MRCRGAIKVVVAAAFFFFTVVFFLLLLYLLLLLLIILLLLLLLIVAIIFNIIFFLKLLLLLLLLFFVAVIVGNESILSRILGMRYDKKLWQTFVYNNVCQITSSSEYTFFEKKKHFVFYFFCLGIAYR